MRIQNCDWTSEICFARDRNRGVIAAFAGVVLDFESDLPDEDEFHALGSPALPRDAVAVFIYRNSAWEWSGRTLFNMDPQGALERMANQFDAIALTSK